MPQKLYNWRSMPKVGCQRCCSIYFKVCRSWAKFCHQHNMMLYHYLDCSCSLHDEAMHCMQQSAWVSLTSCWHLHGSRYCLARILSILALDVRIMVWGLSYHRIWWILQTLQILKISRRRPCVSWTEVVRHQKGSSLDKAYFLCNAGGIQPSCQMPSSPHTELAEAEVLYHMSHLGQTPCTH